MLTRLVAIALLAYVVSGCAHDAAWMQHRPGVESTIGTDMNKAKAGQVIQPPGLGVDLSNRTRHRDPKSSVVVTMA